MLRGLEEKSRGPAATWKTSARLASEDDGWMTGSPWYTADISLGFKKKEGRNLTPNPLICFVEKATNAIDKNLIEVRRLFLV